MADEPKTELTLEAIQTLITSTVQDITNKYDKNLEKQIGKHLTPVIEDLKQQISSGMKPKKLAKLLRREEEAKAAKAAAKAGKTPEEIAAAEKLAADAIAAGKKPAENKDKEKDMFRRRRDEEMEDRLKVLEQDKLALKLETENAKLDSALDRVLTDFPWANLESRDLARDRYRPRLKRDDEGNILIEDQKFEAFIKAEIPTKFENLLSAKNKGGSGIQKGTGKGPTAADLVEEIGPNSTPEQKAAAARAVAGIYGVS